MARFENLHNDDMVRVLGSSREYGQCWGLIAGRRDGRIRGRDRTEEFFDIALAWRRVNRSAVIAIHTAGTHLGQGVVHVPCQDTNLDEFGDGFRGHGRRHGGGLDRRGGGSWVAMGARWEEGLEASEYIGMRCVQSSYMSDCEKASSCVNGPGRVGRGGSLAVSGLGAAWAAPSVGMSRGGGESIGGRTG